MQYLVIELQTIDLCIFTSKGDCVENDFVMTKILNLGLDAYWSNRYDIVLKTELDFKTVDWFIREGY